MPDLELDDMTAALEDEIAAEIDDEDAAASAAANAALDKDEKAGPVHSQTSRKSIMLNGLNKAQSDKDKTEEATADNKDKADKTKDGKAKDGKGDKSKDASEQKDNDVAEPRTVGDKLKVAAGITGAALVGLPIAGAHYTRHKMQKGVDNFVNDAVGAVFKNDLRPLPNISNITGLGDKDHQGYEP